MPPPPALASERNLVPKVLSSLLLAHEAPDFERVHQRRETEAGRQRFLLLGRFDLLVLQTCNDLPEGILHRSLASNARAASGCAYLAHVLGEPEFDPAAWAAGHPLLGYCSLRLARRALKTAGSFDFLREFLAAHLAGRDDIRWVLASGTGWEDVTVLFFGRSFNAIKQAIGLLRGIHNGNVSLPAALDRHDGLHHLILTSCTLPGIALDHWDRDWDESRTKTLLACLEADEPLRWAVRVETHPGHWDAFVRLLEQKSQEAGLRLEMAPLFGQSDLRVTPAGKEQATHRGLITFLMEIIFKLESMENSVVRTVETRLIPEMVGYHEDTEAEATTTRKRPRAAFSTLEDFKQQSKPALEALGVPPHTLHALEETLSRISGMAWDRLHGEEFSAIRALADSFVKFTRLAPLSKSSSAHGRELEARETLRDISDWQMQVERCLADRFRGPYPAGDSLMVRLSSHPGTHHRFLVVMDHFAQQIYDIARYNINRRLASQTFPEAAIATFIGNSPTAYAIGHLIRRLGCGFTDVPAHMVGRLQDTHIVAHETGHHFFRAFLCHAPHVRELILAETAALPALGNKEVFTEEEVFRDVREILAEVFASHFCFPGDSKQHELVSYRTIRAYYHDANPDNSFLRSVLMDVSLRHFAVQALIQSRSAEETSYDRLVAGYLARIKLDSASDRYARANERIQATRRALLVIARLRMSHLEFDALLTALEDCGKTLHFPGDMPDKSFLNTYRTFMTGPQLSAGENLAFLDQLWFMVLQSQTSLLS